MTARREWAPEATDALRRLRSIQRRVRTLEALYEERSDVFAELQRCGLTQQEIADAAGVTKVAVHKVLAKRVSRST